MREKCVAAGERAPLVAEDADLFSRLFKN